VSKIVSQKAEVEWLQMVVWGRKLVGSIWTINKGLLSKPDRGAKLALAHCDRLILKLSEVLSVKEVEGSYMQPN
jgi:hypothetical protein